MAAVGRRMERLAEIQSEGAAPGDRLTLISADVRDRKGLRSALERVGPVAALVANAGICKRTWLCSGKTKG